MKTRLFLLILAASILSCTQETEQITNVSDYEKYLDSSENKALELALKDNTFWKDKWT